MATTALDLFDIFRGVLPEQGAREAAIKLDALVGEKAEAVAERRTREMATKGDIHALKDEVHAVKHEILKWTMAGFITIFLAIIALAISLFLSGH